MRTDQRANGTATLAFLLLFVAAPGHAASTERTAVEFFEQKVRPILVERCFACHSQAAGKKKGGLVLDSRAALLRGGDSGPAVVPGQPDKSLLFHAVRHANSDLKMPPKAKLAEAQIADLAHWIKQGAIWPGTETARPAGKITEADRQWWAFQTVAEPVVPPVENPGRSSNPIDRFIYHQLQAEGLASSPPAERAVLLRRVYFDLIGLPPAPAEVDAALADQSSEWYEKVVDRLLASPRYGERWARHWLDVVRYAESDGFRVDDYRSQAWRYRDYVIASFNADKPYDRFVQEQLAGDELWPDDPQALIATGYLRHWTYEFNQRDVRAQWANILNDLTDVTGEALLGLGMGCARCHDHKFDPILQKDYYRLQAFFAGILPRDDVPLVGQREIAKHQEKMARWEAQTATVRREMGANLAAPRRQAIRTATGKFPEDIQAMLAKPTAGRTPLEHQLADLAHRQVTYELERIEGRLKGPSKERYRGLKHMLAEFATVPPAPLPVGMTVSDAGPQAPPTSIPRRGTIAVEPGFLTILDEKPAVIPVIASRSTGRRSVLARWITRPDHPLTARVIVNRVWHYHFGRGLVATTNDFGRLGEKPSHPELLDWLARHLVDDGWSIKRLHRRIVTAAVYRQSATAPAPAAALRKDPDNRLLWKMATRRLDAEQVRDAMLWATGELDLAAGGPSVEPDRPRRTIYTRVLRNTRDPLLDAFDLPEGFTSTGRRNTTTTPTQSLLLINSPAILQRAHAMANRLRKAEHADDEQLIDAALRLTFGRHATTADRQRFAAFLRTGKDRAAALVDFCHVLLNANEFLYVD